jgi:hypothetical protein
MSADSCRHRPKNDRCEAGFRYNFAPFSRRPARATADLKPTSATSGQSFGASQP